MRIKNWINNIMKGNIKPNIRELDMKRNSEIEEITSTLREIKVITKSNLEDFALSQSSYDILLVTYTLNKQFNGNEYKIFFSECARFK